jgi:hypothetical protein
MTTTLADKKISEMTPTTTIGDADLVPTVQGGINKYVLGSNARTELGIFTDTGTVAKLRTPRDIDLQTQGLRDANVTTAIKLGDISNTSFNTTNKTIAGAINEILAIVEDGDSMTWDGSIAFSVFYAAQGLSTITRGVTIDLQGTGHTIDAGTYTNLDYIYFASSEGAGKKISISDGALMPQLPHLLRNVTLVSNVTSAYLSTNPANLSGWYIGRKCQFAVAVPALDVVPVGINFTADNNFPIYLDNGSLNGIDRHTINVTSIGSVNININNNLGFASIESTCIYGVSGAVVNLNYTIDFVQPISFINFTGTRNDSNNLAPIVSPVSVLGGLKDANVSTAINLGDTLNTSFETVNKTIVGAVNEARVWNINSGSAQLTSAAPINAQSQSINNLANPLTSTDAANKFYVDSSIGASAGANDAYFDSTNLLPIGTQNNIKLNSLTFSPLATTEQSASVAVTSATSPMIIEAYLYNTAMQRTQIDGGTWYSDLYASVSNTASASSIITNIYQGLVEPMTITVTGTGTTRTVTANSGSPFVAGDANSDLTLCSYIETSTGLYPISGYTLSNIVSITVPSTYTNQTTVAFTKFIPVISLNSGTISSTTISLIRSAPITSSNFPINLTDKLAAITFATTASVSSVTIEYTYNGATRASFTETPLRQLHNSLAGVYTAGIGVTSGHIDNGVLANGIIATTQSAGDNSTKVATTAYVDNAVGLENLWDRVSTTLSPHNANDSVNIGSGTYTGGILSLSLSGGVSQLLDTVTGSDSIPLFVGAPNLAAGYKTSIHVGDSYGTSDFGALDYYAGATIPTTYVALRNNSGANSLKLFSDGTTTLNTKSNKNLNLSPDGTGVVAISTLITNGLLQTSGSNGTIGVSNVLLNGVTATTQSAGDNSTKVATTAYVDNAVGTSEYWQRDSADSTLIPYNVNDSIRLQLVPANAQCYATLDSTTNLTWGLGSFTTTPVGGAAINGGVLDLNYNDKRHLDCVGTGNVSGLVQTGAIKFIWTPGYSGIPVNTQIPFSISQANANANNLIQFTHVPTTGNLILWINEAGGNTIVGGLGMPIVTGWSPTSGTSYEFEINFDCTGGTHRLFINGTLAGTLSGRVGVRSSNIGLLRIGNHYGQGTFYDNNNSLSKIIFYNTVQHTANYTPGYTLSDTPATTLQQVTGGLSLVESNLLFSANTISSTNTNGNINLNPNGTGAVVINSSSQVDSPIITTASTNSTSSVTMYNMFAPSIINNGIIYGHLGKDIDNNLAFVYFNTTLPATSRCIMSMAYGGSTVGGMNFYGDGNINIGGDGDLILDPTGNLNAPLLAKASGYVATDASGNLTAVTFPSIPTQYWQRNTTTLSPLTSGDSLAIGNLNLTTNTISSTNTNGNINLSPNGSGEVLVRPGINDVGITLGRSTEGTTPFVSTTFKFASSDNVIHTRIGLAAGAGALMTDALLNDLCIRAEVPSTRILIGASSSGLPVIIDYTGNLSSKTITAGGVTACDANYCVQAPNDSGKKVKANAYDTYSCALKYKSDIKRIDNPLDHLDLAEGIIFKFSYPEGHKYFHLNGKQSVVIPADHLDALQKATGMTGLVSKDEKGEYNSINLTNTIPYLLECIKHLKDKVSILEKR